MSAAFSKSRPQTTKVLIRTNPDAASVNDDSADAQRRQGKQASRQTRSKHALEEPLLQATPRQKRSRFAVGSHLPLTAFGYVTMPKHGCPYNWCCVLSLCCVRLLVDDTLALQVGTGLPLDDRLPLQGGIASPFLHQLCRVAQRVSVAHTPSPRAAKWLQSSTPFDHTPQLCLCACHVAGVLTLGAAPIKRGCF